MSGCFIDTNVILRYLLDDNEEQALLAEHVINGGAWTTPEVLAEVTHVLKHHYSCERREIFTALELTANVVELRPYAETLEAIREYGETGLDFVDCMASAYNKCGESVFTFYIELNRRMSETSTGR